ncbi:hypothetical protein FOZ63_005993 [Perkinsus olseni]|uniref:Uncharacterized protein n=1 Tax=Perkinsus olseni TaxID=32597 RepID=A0A7J6PDC5_PEROL|nr:hypothetical protein FOZ63_005993 [Perkinsus olseni]
MALCRRNRVMKALFTKDFELYKWVVKQLGLRLVRFNYMALKDPSKTVNAIAVDGDKVKWMLQQRLWRHRYRPRNVKHPQTGKLVRYTRHLVKPPPANFGKPVPVRQQISKRWPYGVTPERVSGTYTVRPNHRVLRRQACSPGIQPNGSRQRLRPAFDFGKMDWPGTPLVFVCGMGMFLGFSGLGF